MPSDAKEKTGWGHRLRLLVSVTVLVVVGAALITINNQTDPGSCQAKYRNDQKVEINSQTLQVEVARGKQEQQRGLGGRACIDTDQAMLFVFEKPGHYSFWMKDMLFSIDIIWISADRKVVGIENQVEPSTYPDGFVNKGQPAKYVLELKAGHAKALGIGLGTPVNF
jgi:uncharacterized membrane protein (UPF0127 family)